MGRNYRFVYFIIFIYLIYLNYFIILSNSLTLDSNVSALRNAISSATSRGSCPTQPRDQGDRYIETFFHVCRVRLEQLSYPDVT